MPDETREFFQNLSALGEEIQELRERADQVKTLSAALDRLEADLALVWHEMEYYYDCADRLANTPIKAFPMVAAEFKHNHRVRTVPGPESSKALEFSRIRNLLEEKGHIKPTAF